MTLRDLFGGKEVKLVDTSTTLKGKIIHLDDRGFGFIISQEKEFERIFFHWTGLLQDTLRFKELHKGMEVEFVPIDYTDKVTGKSKGWRAIKIRVIE